MNKELGIITLVYKEEEKENMILVPISTIYNDDFVTARALRSGFEGTQQGMRS